MMSPKSDTSIAPPEMVTEQAALRRHCEEWRAAGVFAFDTEFIRDDTYDAALCLVQVSAGGQVLLVDPTAKLDLAPFWDVVLDGAVVKVVHAGKEDLEVCLKTTGKVPHNIYDVQIAAGFVGYGYPLSLLRLVENLLHRRLAKAQTLTDWLRRPLTPAQMRYAVEDVTHLPELYERLRAEVAQAGRSAWVAEEMKCFEDAEFYRAPVEERALRLKGSKKLDGLGLAVLERLVQWRDQWAQSRNRPIRALMRDDVLVEIARRRPQHETDLEVMRGFHQARNRKLVRELLDLIAETAKVPKSQWPKPYERRDESLMAAALLDLLSAITQAVCHEEQLSRNLLGGTQRLRELLDFQAGRTKSRPALLCGWREEFIARRLVALLKGRSEIHLSGWPDNLRLDVVSHPAPKRERGSP
jgi:ribonuclease D